MSRPEDRTRNVSLRDQRRLAWSDAKLAVRRYAHDPSDANAGRVNQAWRKVRRAMTAALDRRVQRELDGISFGNRIQGP